MSLYAKSSMYFTAKIDLWKENYDKTKTQILLKWVKTYLLFYEIKNGIHARNKLENFFLIYANTIQIP